ncbi:MULTISPECIES: phosphopantetheine-binding protein [unclassified Streptomyces]|uniref:phosphopantetheine-binding protein n=1 Tax=unclassified Streptomyces TaxID=2593676 RepID=UPI002E7862AC|nr:MULTISPECIES: phosphopantetheine-binding protein [unclassified Streptomyces]MEE1760765.1 phosphopantetheine-binding protein [Streptomyces sp. SP18BB07]MEE1835692.1 phosphopantetheine-binding protein [Streptomyces sp. SP17KL33]
MSDGTLEVRQRIRALLVDLFGNDRLVGNVSDTVSLRQAGMSSTALVSLLVAMEDAFGFEWDEDVRPEVLRSIESLADHVVSLR